MVIEMERRAFGMQGRHATRAELAELAEVIAMTDNMSKNYSCTSSKTSKITDGYGSTRFLWYGCQKYEP